MGKWLQSKHNYRNYDFLFVNNMGKELLLEWFKSLSKESVAIAGGKGASLGEMTRAGIPVPNGYVILSSSFEKFLEETDLNVELDSILDQVNHKEMQSIEDASEEIKALIMNAKMPKDIEKEIVKDFKILDSKFVAVRSSATSEDSSSAAWAGQLDSFLNTTNKTLLENVKRCWASLFTPRAIFYRFEKGLHDTKISVAVVVQKMVESEVSGIAFSVHPVTQDRNQLIIEAGFGLGEAIVSGQITPDSYVVEKVPRRIIDKNVSDQERGLFKIQTGGNEWKSTKANGAQQKLSDKQILELSEIILRIEKHYGFPCDIEWAFEKGKFYIVQSRPITTLTDKSGDKEMPSVVKANKPIVENKFKKKELIADLSSAKQYLENNPLDIKEAKCSLLAGDILFREYAEENCFGLNYSPIFIPYANAVVSQIIPEAKMKEFERKSWDVFINDKKKFQTVLHEANRIQKKIDYISLDPKGIDSISDKQLLTYFSKLEELMREWWRIGAIGEEKGLVVEEKIVPMLMNKFSLSPDEAREYVMTYTLPSEQSIFSKERVAFLDLCILAAKDKELIGLISAGKELKGKKYVSFLSKMKEYSKKYFYSRSDFYSAKYLDYKTLSGLISVHCSSTPIVKIVEEKEHILKNYEKLINDKKKLSKKVVLAKGEKQYLEYFTALQLWLDERKLSMLKHFYYLFIFQTEVSKRKKIEYSTISLMDFAEVKSVISNKKLDLNLVKAREQNAFYIYQEGQKELLFVGEEAKELKKSIFGANDSSSVITGTVASKGKDSSKIIVGVVKIIFDPSKDSLEEGEILVTSMTRPEFVPIMKKAKAIITDEGGIACHAAIVSRELGIPCIIGTKKATKLLSTGSRVEIDAEKGIIKILK